MKKNEYKQVQRDRTPVPALEERVRGLIDSPRTLAICIFCSGFAMAGSVWWLNSEMDLYEPGKLVSDIEYFLLTYIHLPSILIQVTSHTSPVLIFAMFMLAALVFSMALAAWCFTDGSNSRKTPNKLLSFTVVAVGLGLQAWVGLTLEEFFLIALPSTVGTVLFASSVTMGRGKRIPLRL